MRLTFHRQNVLATTGFPPPWTAEVTPNSFIVRDAKGQALTNNAKLPEPLRKT